jgi:hypothetical protein
MCHERMLQLEKLVDCYKCVGKPDNPRVGCCLGKQARMPYNHPVTRATKLLELVHSDVCTCLQTESFGKSHYMLTFTDDYSRKTFVYFLKFKDEVFDKFVEFKANVETQIGEKIETLKTDFGTECLTI